MVSDPAYFASQVLSEMSSNYSDVVAVFIPALGATEEDDCYVVLNDPDEGFCVVHVMWSERHGMLYDTQARNLANVGEAIDHAREFAGL